MDQILPKTTKKGALMLQVPTGTTAPAAGEVTTLPTCEELYRTHRDRIHRYLRRFVSNPEEAEDLTQETFLRVHKGLPRLQGPLNATAWLHRIATNVAYDALRRRQLIRWESTEAMNEEVHYEPACGREDDPQTWIAEAELVQSVLAALPATYRTALQLQIVEGYRIEEVARAVGIPLNGAKMLVWRARNRFRAVYQEQERRDNAHPACP